MTHPIHGGPLDGGERYRDRPFPWRPDIRLTGFSHEGHWFDILPGLKAGDSHFTEASQCALTCTQDLQLLDGLTPPVRRPKHCGRR